ncbi:hypothetical protein [Desulfoferrobacter suflitae]|uniref:hypothetical protein n=1 Tax=Desulfoferrobacter suflitae TaxID=2865782 RepID=UPI002164BC79|nr:hypothetical protein [Desulfoferrobacter suflitae]MCK8602861.1 hypothetical protein [Desulfoferrobacter suflitae]
MANEKTKGRESDRGIFDRDDDSSIPGKDGMSAATAKAVIDRDLRQKIMQDYDLVELENKGRYYAAKAYSKDGCWLNELLIDKQTGSISVVSRIEMHRDGNA